MTELNLEIFAAILSLGALAASIVAILWLRKLRASVARALAESTSQQVRAAQRLYEALAQIQKTQQGYERQLQALSQANAQLRQGLTTVSTRLEHAQTSPGDFPQQRPTIH